jgi:hypothetical protein
MQKKQKRFDRENKFQGERLAKINFLLYNFQVIFSFGRKK